MMTELPSPWCSMFFFSGYLKLWQLSKPQLTGYDAIFVDEAQDCTPGECRQSCCLPKHLPEKMFRAQFKKFLPLSCNIMTNPLLGSQIFANSGRQLVRQLLIAINIINMTIHVHQLEGQQLSVALGIQTCCPDPFALALLLTGKNRIPV